MMAGEHTENKNMLVSLANKLNLLPKRGLTQAVNALLTSVCNRAGGPD